MIRLILLILVSVLYLIVTLPVLLVLMCIGIWNSGLRDKIAGAMVRFIFRIHLLLAGTKVTVIGRERIPQDRPVLYVGNHRSIFDIVVSYRCVRGNSGFIAKKVLKKIPIFSLWMKYIGCLFLDRNSAKDGMKMIKDSIGKIERGNSVFVFPEGTRSRQKEDLPLLKFHEGALRIATHSGAPIVPVAISNTADILESHMPRVKKTHVIIEFCDPIETAGLDRTAKRSLGSRLSEIISSAIAENQTKV